MSPSKAERLRQRLTIDPDAPEPTPAPPPSANTAPPAAVAGARVSALDDPAIRAGRNGYRSFYVDDAVFARFRAAIYWLARREDAMGSVPENMSVAVEEFMCATADDLERRFNGGEVFRATPDQLKPSRKKRGKSSPGPSDTLDDL